VTLDEASIATKPGAVTARTWKGPTSPPRVFGAAVIEHQPA
jgi:hypothetical protein